MKKIVSIVLALVLALGVMAGCSNGNGAENNTKDTQASNTTASGAETTAAAPKSIYVVSREDGSGTRGAFVELMGVKTDEGDMTTETAEICNSTSLVQTTVSGNAASIGYISLGALDETAVKAVEVDGVAATVENVQSGSYAVSRPFVICYQEENLTELGKDFIHYIMSVEGQTILSDEKYIADPENAPEYTPANLSGNLSLNGSTSVGPVMEKIAEHYKEQNPDVVIDIQQTGSGSGIEATINGSCEIGMSSRALKDEELAQGLTAQTIAMDGIAVIVNLGNPVQGLTSEQIRQIFTGELTDWNQVG